MKEIAERAVRAKGWRWLLGVVSLPDDKGRTWRRVGEGWAQESGKRLRCRVDESSLVPDLTDPATLGCLLALVREAWDMPRINTFCADGWWGVHSPLLNIRFPIRDKKNNSEAAALVKALEAAP